jgi:hypothetical protein
MTGPQRRTEDPINSSTQKIIWPIPVDRETPFSTKGAVVEKGHQEGLIASYFVIDQIIKGGQGDQAKITNLEFRTSG